MLRAGIWTCFVVMILCTYCEGHLTMPDYTQHPCTRPCQDDTRPMTCVYNFTMEWYHVLSKACFDCPHNVTDCFRPHCVSADGFYRGVQVVNRMMPGPAIQVCHNDMIIVHVLNRMETFETTSIHWHGIHQKEYQYMDGVAMLTQCPISANSIFTYKFKAEPAGTHFWHAHAGMQRGDGVAGALIVRQPPVTEPHTINHLYDQDLPEHVLLIQDWLHELTIQKFTAHHHAGGSNKARSMLINGRGAKVNVTDANGQEALTPFAKFTVTKGQRYRFRLISNAVTNCPIQISIDRHNLTVIASDGSPFEAYETRNLVIHAGERYDFVLNANQPVGNHLIRAAGLGDCDKKFFGATQAAVLHYDGASDDMPDFKTNYNDMINDGKVLNPMNQKASTEFIPISEMVSLRELKPDPALREKADYQFFFGMDFNGVDNVHFNHPELYPLRVLRRGQGLFSPQLNNISNMFSSSPMLSQPGDVDPSVFCTPENTKTCGMEAEYCSCYHRFHVRLNSVVEVVIVDEGFRFDASHPMHLHGYSFRVVAMKKVDREVTVETVKQMDRDGLIERNLKDPPKKDTVVVPDGGFTVIRFYADNPGEWFFHCHLLFHAEIGMGLTFGVGEQSDLPPVPPYFPRCGNFGPAYSIVQEKAWRKASSASHVIMSYLLIIAMAIIAMLK